MSDTPNPSASAAPAPPAARWRRAMAWAVAGALVLLAAAVLMLALALPQLHRWRGELQARASAALGVPVTIRALHGEWVGMAPRVTLEGVQVHGPGGGAALTVPRAQAGIAWRSLWQGRLVLAPLQVDGLALQVERSAEGRWRVAGVELAQAPGPGHQRGQGDALDWLLEQPDLRLAHGQITFNQLGPNAPPPLRLADVDLRLAHLLGRHTLTLAATPEPGWGQRMTLAATLHEPLLGAGARSGQPRWAAWPGTVAVDLPAFDLARWAPYSPLWPGPAPITQGRGSLKGQFTRDAHGWQAVQASVQGENGVLRLGRALPLALSHWQATLAAERDGERLRLALTDTRFTLPGSPATPPLALTLDWLQPQAQDDTDLLHWDTQRPTRSGRVQASSVSLAALDQLAARVPLPERVHALLARLQPRGLLEQVSATWQGDWSEPRTWQASARASALALAAEALPAQGAEGHLGRPGFSGADVTVQASQAGGSATVQMANGALDLPGVFEQPQLPLSRLQADLQWTATAQGQGLPPAIDLRVRGAQFANADAHGSFSARWRTGPASGSGAGRRYPGLLDLDGSLPQGDGRRVARYLPLGIPKSVRDYVGQAVRAGTVQDARFAVHGDLWQFPFTEPGQTGVFRIAGRAAGVELAYLPAEPPSAELPQGVPAWPAFTQVQGELVFDRASMAIHRAEGRLWGMALHKVEGSIANLAQQPELRIAGEASGPLDDALRYLRETPISRWMDHALSDAQGSGNAELTLALQVPLERAADTQVQGSLAFGGNTVQVAAGVPTLRDARGRLTFSQRGFAVQGATAQALGGPLRLHGGTQADGQVRLAVSGEASAEGLAASSELGPLAGLARTLSGRSAYALDVALTEGRTELSLTSELEGMASSAPAPLAKPAAARWPLRVQTRRSADGGGTLDIRLGQALRAHYQRSAATAGASPRVRHGRVWVGEAAVGEAAADGETGAAATAVATGESASDGVSAQVRLAALDADAWRDWWRRAEPVEATPSSAASAAFVGLPRQADAGGAAEPRGGVNAKGVADAASAYLPTRVVLDTPALRLAGRDWHDVALDARRESPQWRVQLKARQAQGQLRFDSQQVNAHLDKLEWPAEAAVEAAATAHAPAQDAAAANPATRLPPPGQWPRLVAQVDELRLGARRLGALELAGQPHGGGWDISTLRLKGSGGEVSGTGRVSAAPALCTALDLSADVDDLGAWLTDLGYAQLIRRGKGAAEARLTWPGTPMDFSLAQLGGQGELALTDGRILAIEPGAARLLGVLSLQTLPRRLTLDFSDVFAKGLSFDDVSGALTLQDGVARSNNLAIRGVQAAILAEGQADLTRETQDLRVVVVPEINAGTASLAYAVINPVVGLGSFLAQYLLRKPLQDAGTRELHITGSWDEPQVQALKRAAPASAPR